MNRFIVLFVLCIHVLFCRAYDVMYEKADSIKVMTLLSDAREQNDDVDYIIYFARKLRGVPYVSHTLEINKTEKLIVNLRQLDCTTYVENVLALYLCIVQKSCDFRSFCDNLCKIRYRKGTDVHYVSRLHYFTDWIEDNTAKGVCNEIRTPDPPFSGIQTVNVNYMSSNPDKYKMLVENPSYLPAIAEMEKRINKKVYKYIPKSEIRNTALLRKAVHNGDIIAITTTLNGLDIQHIGFAVWHKDGLHLLNASSIHHKVVEESMTLFQYLQRKKTMTGIRIVRIKL